MGMEVLKQVEKSITGNTSKAVLCIYKMEEAGGLFTEVDKNVKEGEKPKESIGSIWTKEVANVFRGAQSSMMDASGLNNMLSQQIDAQDSVTPLSVLNKKNYHLFSVQYNPSSIHFESVAGSFINAGVGSGGVTQISQCVQPAQTLMSVQLIFDDVNNRDAFMFDNFRLSAGDIVAIAAENREHSVEQEVAGLISLIISPLTRMIVFHWGKMTFYGELENVDAKYTMFNPKGNPIRAVVSLRIRQMIEGGESTADEYWNNAYTKQFPKGGVGAKIDNIAASSGNLLNLL